MSGVRAHFETMRGFPLDRFQIDALDALDGGLEQFAGRHIAGADERRLIGSVHPACVVGE